MRLKFIILAIICYTISLNSMLNINQLHKAVLDKNIDAILTHLLTMQEANEHALRLAVLGGDEFIVTSLLKPRISPLAKTANEETPLYYALNATPSAQNGRILKELLKNTSLQIPIIDDQGNGLLHRAVKSKNPLHATNLLSAGANMFIRNERGETPLDLAKEAEELEFLPIFESYLPALHDIFTIPLGKQKETLSKSLGIVGLPYQATLEQVIQKEAMLRNEWDPKSSQNKNLKLSEKFFMLYNTAIDNIKKGLIKRGFQSSSSPSSSAFKKPTAPNPAKRGSAEAIDPREPKRPLLPPISSLLSGQR